MTFAQFLLSIAALSAIALAIILADPKAARLASRSITRTASALGSLLDAHAAAREGARLAYRRIWRARRNAGIEALIVPSGAESCVEGMSAEAGSVEKWAREQYARLNYTGV